MSGLEGADDFSLLVEKLAPLHLAAVGDECRELLERLNPLLDLLEHFGVDRGDRVDRKYPDQAEAMLLRFDVTISRLEVDIRNIELHFATRFESAYGGDMLEFIDQFEQLFAQVPYIFIGNQVAVYEIADVVGTGTPCCPGYSRCCGRIVFRKRTPAAGRAVCREVPVVRSIACCSAENAGRSI